MYLLYLRKKCDQLSVYRDVYVAQIECTHVWIDIERCAYYILLHGGCARRLFCFLILLKRIGSHHIFTWLGTITFRMKAFSKQTVNSRFFFVLEFWHMFHLNWVDWTRSTFNCIKCIQYCISIHWSFKFVVFQKFIIFIRLSMRTNCIACT